MISFVVETRIQSELVVEVDFFTGATALFDEVDLTTTAFPSP
jgi:hypothetical protein